MLQTQGGTAAKPPGLADAGRAKRKLRVCSGSWVARQEQVWTVRFEHSPEEDLYREVRVVAGPVPVPPREENTVERNHGIGQGRRMDREADKNILYIFVPDILEKPLSLYRRGVLVWEKSAFNPNRCTFILVLGFFQWQVLILTKQFWYLCL